MLAVFVVLFIVGAFMLGCWGFSRQFPERKRTPEEDTWRDWQLAGLVPDDVVDKPTHHGLPWL